MTWDETMWDQGQPTGGLREARKIKTVEWQTGRKSRRVIRRQQR